MFISPDAAAIFDGPRKFRQLVNFAHQCGLERRPFADAEDASEPLNWSSGPAGKRASLALQAAQQDAYRGGQVQNTSSAVDEFMADNHDPQDNDKWAREALIESAVIVAACATHAKDGARSTLMTRKDIIRVISKHILIDRPRFALKRAGEALRDFHVGWPDPTPEGEREVRESLAVVEAHFAADAIFADMADDGDLTEDLCNAYPDLKPSSAEKIAHRTLERRAYPPQGKFVSDTSHDPFATQWVEPDERDRSLHLRACEALGIEPDLEAGEAEQPEASDEQAEADILTALKHLMDRTA